MKGTIVPNPQGAFEYAQGGTPWTPLAGPGPSKNCYGTGPLGACAFAIFGQLVGTHFEGQVLVLGGGPDPSSQWISIWATPLNWWWG